MIKFIALFLTLLISTMISVPAANAGTVTVINNCNKEMTAKLTVHHRKHNHCGHHHWTKNIHSRGNFYTFTSRHIKVGCNYTLQYSYKEETSPTNKGSFEMKKQGYLISIPGENYKEYYYCPT